MNIIPAIDLIDGKCVRLRQGDFNTQKIYNENPLEVARQFEDHGLRHLHLVDLDGARAQRLVNYRVLETIAAKTRLHIDVGGGIRSDDDARIAFECGAAQITGGSIALREPEVFLAWLERYGSDKIILGADCREGKIAVQGWQETSGQEVLDFIQKFEKQGVQTVICTEISKDGLLQGPAFDLYDHLLKNSAVQLVASGGVAALADLERLRELGCSGAIVGKAIY
ncbi:MAG: 1-(5-phosphoribosyl)-5-[(5-phosphoribosylamino)methylideneamino]imidazole-4-carboxamide isomerase, partial [Saprospiraceae bacterium]|nr:1-(5-phosphoribosyl)-5-[(5-phosphoribosylamino)methylideneamino]imidazole-4-carboxamide isomerase [Saprospiraceae bacterium]